MTEIFKMPDVGEGMAEGEIASWLVKVGDTINRNTGESTDLLNGGSITLKRKRYASEK